VGCSRWPIDQLFGAPHSSKVWDKHLEHLAVAGHDISPIRHVLKEAASKAKLTRRQVFTLADTDPSVGVAAAIIWGFPRGGLPGGKWRPFAEAFA